MIGQRADAVLDQPLGGLLHLLARQAVDDAALAAVRCQKIAQLLLALVALDDGVGNVRPVKAGGEDARILEAEAFDDVGARRRIGCCGERHARHAGEVAGDARQLAIFGPEVMAPLADAVRFVDRKEADVRFLQHLLEAGRHQTFGRDVEQLQAIGAEIVAHGARFVGIERGVEHRGRNAGLFQCLDLIAHQGDQGRHDDGDARTAQRGNLIAD